MLDSITGGEPEMAAYNQAKAAMASCMVSGVLGTGLCTQQQAADAAAGLSTLQEAERDPRTITITFNNGQLGYNAPDGSGRLVTVNPGDARIGRRFTVPGVVMHEVMEGWYFLNEGGNADTRDPMYDQFHPRAIRFGEDPVYLGHGCESRTSRGGADFSRRCL